MRFLLPIELREFEGRADDLLRGRSEKRYDRCTFEITDVDGTVKIAPGKVDSDTLLLSIKAIPAGSFYPNPETRLVGVEVDETAFLSQEECEAAAEELRAYRLKMNPPVPFKRIEEANGADEVGDNAPKIFEALDDDGDEREDRRLSPEVAAELHKFEADLAEFRRTHVEDKEFRESPDFWEPDTYNEPQGMAHAPILKSEPVTWSTEGPQRVGKEERERLMREAEMEELQVRRKQMEEFPILLQMATSIEDWRQIRVRQLQRCGLSKTQAVSRAIEEAQAGCLGNTRITNGSA